VRREPRAGARRNSRAAGGHHPRADLRLYSQIAQSCPLTGKSDIEPTSPNDRVWRTLNDQLQKWWSELVPPYDSGVLHPLTAAFGTKRPLDKS